MHPQASNIPNTSRRAARRLSLIACLACAGLTLPAPVLAADAAPAAQKASTGVVEGRVYNAGSGTFLNNARVRVEGTALQAYTNERGEYNLRNVPAGAARLRVTYAGQQDLVEEVTVDGETIATANFTFNASVVNADAKTVTLDKFVVEASRFRNAQELATNEERTATNIKSVVALDSLGYVRDGNIGEFVRFLPGVDVSNGGTGAGSNPDNASTVSVRGFGADSTMIMVDGVPLASGSPDALTRSVQLDGVSINNASRLEIIKVATPDMRQDAPGGAINLVTRSAFELAKITYNISLAFNGSTQSTDFFKRTPGPYEPNFKTLPSVRISAAIPLSKTLGVTVSAASDNKYSLTRTSNLRDWFYTARSTTATGVSLPVANANGGVRIDNPVIDRLELTENQWVEYRQTGSARVDWRPIPGLELRANGQVSVFDNVGLTRRTQWRYTNGVGIKNWGEDFVEGFQRTATFNPSVRGDMNVDARDRKGFTTQGYLTAKYRRGLWAVDASASASESFNTAPDRANQHFSSVDGVFTGGRMDFTNIQNAIVGEIKMWDANGNPVNYAPLAIWDPILVNGFRARSSEASNRDLVKQYKLDVAREIDFLPFPLTLKAGGLQEIKSNRRWGAGATYEMRYVGPTIANTEIESAYTTDAFFGYAQPQHWMDGHKIYQIYEQHPEYFDDTFVSASQNVNTPAINYLSRVGTAKGLKETTTDYYGMATATFFNNRMTVITGARQSRKERTGYNVFNDPQYVFVKNANGTLYRDSVYTAGVRFDGNENASYAAGDPRRAATAVMTDTALRARMQAAGVAYLPTQLELAPNGTPISNMNQNLFLAKLGRSTRYVNAARTEPVTPQIQVAYDISQSLKVQVAWSKEHRLPDLEGGANTLLVQGASFQIAQNGLPTSDPGGDGTITIANINGKPEINSSYNVKLAYYPKNGSGRYSISYYYKVVDNAWQTDQVFSNGADYDALLESLGLSSSEYVNFRIDSVNTTGIRQIRKGFELEMAQNLGAITPWARGVDVFLTYTRRPVAATAGGEARLGWIPLTPVRAKWTGGISYSARRFSIQARATFTEAGITYNTLNPTVTMPDGTSRVVQLYNLNKTRPDVRLQANYVINKNFTFFATAERVLTKTAYTQIADEQSGLMPEWAQDRTATNRGISFSAGVTATF